MFTGIGLIAFICIFGAGLLGFALRGFLPEHHRTDETGKTVHNIMGVVALLAALVLGLLVASTKSSFDVRSQEVQQFSANLTLLDRELVHFGQDAARMREMLRTFTAHKIAQLWTDRDAAAITVATKVWMMPKFRLSRATNSVVTGAASASNRRTSKDMIAPLMHPQCADASISIPLPRLPVLDSDQADVRRMVPVIREGR